MSRKPLYLALLLAASVLSSPVQAIESSLTYQGSLEDAGQPANGSYDLQFELQDTAGSIIGPVLGRDDVQVIGGVFTVTLDFGATAFNGADRFLRVAVRPGASTGNYTALNPRAEVTAAPYAQVAEAANFAASVAGNSVGTVQVTDNSLTRFDIGTGAVGTDELSDIAVSTAKLADGAVTTDKLQNSAVTNFKIAVGAVSGDRIAPGGINALQIADESLTSVDLGPNSVGLTEVKSAEVQLRVTGTCTAGSAISAVNSNGTVSCENTGAATAWSTSGNSVNVGFLGTTNSTPLELRAQNKRIALFQQDAVAPTVVLGLETNAYGNGVRGAFIAGGGPASDPQFTSVAPNIVLDAYGTVGGGVNNQAGNIVAGNDVPFATVAGGRGNRAMGHSSVVSGGGFNDAIGFHAAVSGGAANSAVGEYALVGGGNNNCAGGDYSFVGGFNAKVRSNVGQTDVGAACLNYNDSVLPRGDSGTFMWADGGATPFVSSGSNQFLVRARGGMALNTTPVDASVELTIGADADGSDYANLWLKPRSPNANGMMISVGDGTGANNNSGFYLDQFNGTAQARRMSLNTDGSAQIRSNTTGGNTGVTMAANAGAWSSLSDRNTKMAIVPVDPEAVLAGVAALPLSTWSYIAQGEKIRHMGPMAQDFAAAFGLGEDDTHISTVDIDGVALAAIQGLNQELKDTRAEVDELKARLARLEAIMALSE